MILGEEAAEMALSREAVAQHIWRLANDMQDQITKNETSKKILLQLDGCTDVMINFLLYVWLKHNCYKTM